MNKKISYFILIAISLIVFSFSLVSADAGDIAKIPVEYSTADGWIQIRDGSTCNNLVYNSATTGNMGVNAYTKCIPDGKTENHTAYFSFNTSNYSGCTINSAMLHYRVNSITTSPRNFTWNGALYIPRFDVYSATDRIGTTLFLPAYPFPGTSIATINPTLITAIGWRNVTIPTTSIANTFTDLEIRPNKDYWTEMDMETKTKTFAIRMNEYAGEVDDPYLELNYTGCPIAPTVNITSPINYMNYTTNPIALNWTAIVNSPLQNLTNAWYILDGGSNVSLWGIISTIDDDTEDNYWNNSFVLDIGNCVDEDWTTHCDVIEMEWGAIFENYTIQASEANWTGKFVQNGINGFGEASISCWNGSIYDEFLPLDFYDGFLEKEIPKECLNQDSLIINTTIEWDGMGGTWGIYYYESNITWFNGTYGNTTLYLEEGNHSVTVCVNDTSNFIGCDTKYFGLGYCGTTWLGTGNWLIDNVNAVCTDKNINTIGNNITLSNGGNLTLINTNLTLGLGDNYIFGSGESYIYLDGYSRLG